METKPEVLEMAKSIYQGWIGNLNANSPSYEALARGAFSAANAFYHHKQEIEDAR